MQTALSKDEGSAQHLSEQSRFARKLGRSVFLAVVSDAILGTSRTALSTRLGLMQDPRHVLFLQRMASLGAATELVVNPLFGKLSDAHGRKLFLLLASVPVTIIRLIAFFCAGSRHTAAWKLPFVLDALVKTPLNTVHFTVFRAMLADKFDAGSLAELNATVGMYAGLGIIGGPLIAELMVRAAHPKYCDLLTAAMSIPIIWTFVSFGETLRPEKRREFVLRDVQPFSFMRLMKDTVLRRLMLATGLQSFTEGRSMDGVAVAHVLNHLKWDSLRMNSLMSMAGVSLILSGVIAQPMMRHMGMRWFTTFSNACNALSLMAFGALPPFGLLPAWAHMSLASVFAAPGGRKRDAVEALIVSIGQDRDFGNGFITGSINNFRSIPNILGPLLLGAAYAWGAKRGRPWAPFAMGALTILAAELCFRSLSAADLGLDAKGHPLERERQEPGAAAESLPTLLPSERDPPSRLPGGKTPLAASTADAATTH